MSGEPALSSKALNLYLIDGRSAASLNVKAVATSRSLSTSLIAQSLTRFRSSLNPIPPYPPSPLREEKKPSYMSIVSTVQGGWTHPRLRYPTVTPWGFEGRSVGFETWEQSEALSTAGALGRP